MSFKNTNSNVQDYPRRRREQNSISSIFSSIENLGVDKSSRTVHVTSKDRRHPWDEDANFFCPSVSTVVNDRVFRPSPTDVSSPTRRQSNVTTVDIDRLLGNGDVGDTTPPRRRDSHHRRHFVSSTPKSLPPPPPIHWESESASPSTRAITTASSSSISSRFVALSSPLASPKTRLQRHDACHGANVSRIEDDDGDKENIFLDANLIHNRSKVAKLAPTKRELFPPRDYEERDDARKGRAFSIVRLGRKDDSSQSGSSPSSIHSEREMRVVGDDDGEDAMLSHSEKDGHRRPIVADEFRRRLLLRTAFRSLRLHVEVQMEDEAHKISLFFRRPKIRRIFSDWRVSTRRKRVASCRVYLTLWREFASDRRSYRLLKLFRERHLVGRVFYRWRERWRDEETGRLVGKRNEIKIKFVAIRKMKKFVESQKCEENRRVETWRARRCFARWVSAWKWSLISQTVSSKRNESLLHRTFVSWTRYFRRRVGDRNLALRLERKRQRRFFLDWRRLTRARSRETLHLCLLAWRDVARETGAREIERFSMLVHREVKNEEFDVEGDDNVVVVEELMETMTAREEPISPTGRRPSPGGETITSWSISSISTDDDDSLKRTASTSFFELPRAKTVGRKTSRNSHSPSEADVFLPLPSVRTISDGYHSGRISLSGGFNGGANTDDSRTFFYDGRSKLSALPSSSIPGVRSEDLREREDDSVIQSLSSTSIEASFDRDDVTTVDSGDLSDFGDEKNVDNADVEERQISLAASLSSAVRPGAWSDQVSKRDLCVWILHRWYFWPLSVIFDRWKSTWNRRRGIRKNGEALKSKVDLGRTRSTFDRWRNSTEKCLAISKSVDLVLRQNYFLAWRNLSETRRRTEKNIRCFRGEMDRLLLRSRFESWLSSAIESRRRSLASNVQISEDRRKAEKYFYLWKEKVARVERLRIVERENATLKESLSLSKLFYAWRRKLRLIRDSKKSGLKRSFLAWRDVANRRILARGATISFRARMIKMAFLHSWRHRLRTRLENEKRIRDDAKLVFVAWVSHVRREKRRKSQLRLHRRVSRLESLRLHFRLWRESTTRFGAATRAADTQTTRASFLAWKESVSATLVLRRVISHWRRFAIRKRELGNRSRFLTDETATALLRTCFHRWISNRGKIVQIRRKRREELLKDCLTRWVRRGREMRSLEDTRRRCERTFSLNLQREYFGFFVASFANRIKVDLFLRAKNHQLSLMAFDSLRSNRRDAISSRMQRKRLLGRRFAAWKEHIFDVRSERERALSLWKLRTDTVVLRKTFSEWHSMATASLFDRKKQRRKIMTETIHVWRSNAAEERNHRLRLKCFNEWRWHVSSGSREESDLIDNFHSFRVVEVVRPCFVRWRNSVASVTSLRRSALNRLSRRSLTAWREQVKSTKRRYDLADSLAADYLLRASWRQWRRKKICADVETKFSFRNDLETLRTAFFTWKVACGSPSSLSSPATKMEKPVVDVSSSPLLQLAAASLPNCSRHRSPPKDAKINVDKIFPNLPAFVIPNYSAAPSEKCSKHKLASIRSESKNHDRKNDPNSPEAKDHPPTSIPSVKVKGLSPFGKKILNMESSSSESEIDGMVNPIGPPLSEDLRTTVEETNPWEPARIRPLTMATTLNPHSRRRLFDDDE